MVRFLRPATSHWFETYVPRGETVYALKALADTGMVELELDPRLTEPLDLRKVRKDMERSLALKRRYKAYLPAGRAPPTGLVKSPEAAAAEALVHIQRWCAQLELLLGRRRQLEQEQSNLRLLKELLIALHETRAELTMVSEPSRFLYKGVFSCPADHPLDSELSAAVGAPIPGSRHNFYIAAGLPDRGEAIENAYRNSACRHIRVPEWLPREAENQKPLIRAQIRRAEHKLARVQEQVEAHRRDQALMAHLDNIALLQWYIEHAADLSAEPRLCHVSGWTTAEDVGLLQQALEQAKVHAVIRFAHPPIFSKPPVSMLRSWWARPFQLFVTMLGTPDRMEIDPTSLLPFIVSLLFGYMFPDLGHGLLLVLFATLLYRRWPDGRFLIPCGLSAAVFGVVFGEVLGMEGLIDPLWIRPMEHPLLVLAIPMAFGVGLMLLGLVFNGIEAHWRNEMGAWLRHDAAVLVIYAAALVGLCCLHAYWAAAAALLWFLTGHLARGDGRRLQGLLQGFGHLLQSVLELALNTFSFLRVGAFALAHAGLTSAILGLAAGIEDSVARILFLCLGHTLIVAVEGLVVFVQTTRLVLFEFFIRFLRADGRVFRPLPLPSEHAAGGKVP